MREARGRSATLDVLLHHGHAAPCVRLTVDPIYRLAAGLFDSWVPQAWILRCWSSAFAEVGAPSFSWRTVTDPITAAAASAARIGWTSPALGELKNVGGFTIDLRKVCPRTIQGLANRDAISHFLKEAVANVPSFRVFGPSAVPWMWPIQLVRSSRVNASWSRLHSALVSTNVAGGVWTANEGAPSCHEGG